MRARDLEKGQPVTPQGSIPRQRQCLTMPTCQGITKKGKPCGMRSRGQFCYPPQLPPRDTSPATDPDRPQGDLGELGGVFEAPKGVGQPGRVSSSPPRPRKCLSCHPVQSPDVCVARILPSASAGVSPGARGAVVQLTTDAPPRARCPNHAGHHEGGAAECRPAAFSKPADQVPKS